MSEMVVIRSNPMRIHQNIASPTATESISQSINQSIYQFSPVSNLNKPDARSKSTLISPLHQSTVFDTGVNHFAESHVNQPIHDISKSTSTKSVSSSVAKKRDFLASVKSLYASLRISCLPSGAQLDGPDITTTKLSRPSDNEMTSEMGSIRALREARSPPAQRMMSEMSSTRRSEQRNRHSIKHRVSHSRHSSFGPNSPSFSISTINSVLMEEQMDIDEAMTIDMSSDDEDGSYQSMQDLIEIVVLNASPLVFIDQSVRSVTPISHLDPDGEKQSINKTIDRTTAPINATYSALTLENLTEELLNAPTILHISGHGLYVPSANQISPSNNQSISQPSESAGDFALALEADNGSVTLLSMRSLNMLLSSMPMPQLVIILACHSEAAAEVFKRNGCPHVIAIKSNERVLDRAARHFTNIFYTAIFASHTVQRAFDIAVSNVNVVFEKSQQQSINSNGRQVSEADKFLLTGAAVSHNVSLLKRKYPRVRCAMSQSFHQQGNRSPIVRPSSASGMQSPSSSRNHAYYRENSSSRNNPVSPREVLFSSTASKDDLAIQMSSYPVEVPGLATSNLPSRPNTIVGREIEVQQCVGGLVNHRLIHLVGGPKIGKSSVALLSAHYMRERSKMENVYYISLAGFPSLEPIVTDQTFNPSFDHAHHNKLSLAIENRLFLCLRATLGLLDVIEYWNVKTLDAIWRLISNRQMLLIFDDCNSLNLIEAVIRSALTHTHRCKFIAISTVNQSINQPISSLDMLDSRATLDGCGVSWSMVEIGPLTPQYSVQLMRRLCADGGWVMKLDQCLSFAQLCKFSPYEMSVRMRHVTQRHRERVQSENQSINQSINRSPQTSPSRGGTSPSSDDSEQLFASTNQSFNQSAHYHNNQQSVNQSTNQTVNRPSLHQSLISHYNHTEMSDQRRRALKIGDLMADDIDV